jgi:hypothetical protein
MTLQQYLVCRECRKVAQHWIEPVHGPAGALTPCFCTWAETNKNHTPRLLRRLRHFYSHQTASFVSVSRHKYGYAKFRARQFLVADYPLLVGEARWNSTDNDFMSSSLFPFLPFLYPFRTSVPFSSIPLPPPLKLKQQYKYQPCYELCYFNVVTDIRSTSKSCQMVAALVKKTLHVIPENL